MPENWRFLTSIVMLLGTVLVLPGGALAERATLQLTDGRTLEGELAEYVPAMHKKNDAMNAASLMTFVTGGVLLGSGFALWINRTSETRRTRELERIDAQLESYGVQAAVSPWVLPSGGSARGLSAGLNLHVTM